MLDKLYPIHYDKKHCVVMANDIIKGKQEMTLQQARVIRLLVTQVAKDKKDLKTYICRIQELASFLSISSSNLYREVRQLCDDLLGLKVRIGTGNPENPWQIVQWMQLAKYDGNGTIILMLSNQILPYIVALDKYFTTYPLENILEMQSYYSIRLYELLKADMRVKPYSNDFEYDISYLREYFGCENKLKQFGQFKEKVIEKAVNEINKRADLTIKVTYRKLISRSYDQITFNVHYRDNKIAKDNIDFIEDPDYYIQFLKDTYF